jgi:hypothetical protein
MSLGGAGSILCNRCYLPSITAQILDRLGPVTRRTGDVCELLDVCCVRVDDLQIFQHPNSRRCGPARRTKVSHSPRIRPVAGQVLIRSVAFKHILTNAQIRSRDRAMDSPALIHPQFSHASSPLIDARHAAQFILRDHLTETELQVSENASLSSGRTQQTIDICDAVIEVSGEIANPGPDEKPVIAGQALKVDTVQLRCDGLQAAGGTPDRPLESGRVGHDAPLYRAVFGCSREVNTPGGLLPGLDRVRPPSSGVATGPKGKP